MPLSLDNVLPAAVIRFESSDENEVVFSCHLDSYTAINTAKSLLRMWIMTTYSDIVLSYKQFDDEFEPIQLDCDVPSLLADKEASKLTDIVTYMTRYTDSNGKMITVSFGLGDSISVNAIIGLPTFRAWELVLD